MQWRDVDGSPATYVVVLEPGDEAVAQLGQFIADHRVQAAQVTAIGAFRNATVGWFDREAKKYRPIRVDEQCEVLSVLGDVAVGDDGPALHVHAVLGLSDGTTRGGHLLEGVVWPTLEVIVRTSTVGLRKTFHPEIGLALIDLARQ